MHIVFLDFDDRKNPLLNAGQAKSTYEIGRRLASRGHRITVISSRYPGYKDRQEDGLEYRHIGLGSKWIRLNNVLYILTIPLAVRKLKADIILECFTAPISTMFTPLFTLIPVVAKPTSFEAERFSRLYHLPFRQIEAFGCRYYRYFMPYSDRQEEKMRKCNQSVICHRAYEGLDDEALNIRRREAKHILYLGRIDMGQKGLDMLVKAYDKIRDKIALPLVIAGAGPDEGSIKQMIAEKGLSDQITMAGASYKEKKAKLMAESEFVVMPSRNEGFGIFALEAIAAGLPLVVFDIPNLSWIGDDVAVKAKAFDIDDLSDKVLAMHREGGWREKMEANKQRYIQKYSWENAADTYESFFSRILSENK